MIYDILTVMWKEGKELFSYQPSLRGGWVGLLFILAVFGVFIPIQSGPDWVNSPINLVIWAWVPFLLVSGVVADSFAGERERHTLETLLASRLSDQAILFGKLGTAIAYGWGLTMVSVLIGLVTTNLLNWDGHILMYPWSIGAGIVLLSLLVSGLSAGLGVLISLRAPSVRHAQQTFSIVFLAMYIPLFILPALPEELKLRLFRLVQGLDYTSIALIIGGVLVGVDLILLGLVMRRFQRAKLILD
jgi:ABC-2 type transport system permease protein